MLFDEIVAKAIVISDITKSPPYKPIPAEDKNSSAGKHMKFEKSDYKMDFARKGNSTQVGNKKVGCYRTFGHFSNARKAKTKFLSFSEKEKLLR